MKQKLKISLVVMLLIAGNINAQPWVGSLNPMATFYKEKGWPAWTEKINWANKINMATYSNGANDFEKFENARDLLYAQGGGVLYYPSGTYDFSNHPTGPNIGRGLMLKAGVVILGDEPATDKWAIQDSVTSGLTTLGTKFLFPFHDMPASDGSIGKVPDGWNMIGLYADSNTRVSDVHHVGIAWVNLVGAYVYFGPDMDWATTWGDLNMAPTSQGGSYRKARWTVYPGDNEAWNMRKTNGQHPGDPMFGAVLDGNYYHSKGGRFVFGCRLDDAAITDTWMNLYSNLKRVSDPRKDSLDSFGNTIRGDSNDVNTYHTYRFASRINLDGANVFVANNALTKSNKNFYYDQRVALYQQPTRTVRTILFDYGKQGGIDVNKSLIVRTANRCNYHNGPFAEENIVIRDNFVFSHGHKGYELAGKWMIVKDNVNSRIFLQEGDNIYGLSGSTQTPSYSLTLEGVQGVGPNSDNMSRAFDLAGWCTWLDGNWWQGTGSNPGNDGEGMLYQTQGGVGFLSTAETFNRQGPTGKDGYLAPWDVPVYGMLQAFNRQRGAVGLLKPDANRIEDAVAVSNFTPSGSPSANAGLNGTNIGDLSFTCPTSVPDAPDSLVVEPDSIRAFIKIAWRDNALNEIGFRIDRQAENSSDWTTVAYRPANVTGSFVPNFGISDLGSRPAGCQNQGPMDLNPQVWYDYLAVPGRKYSYRVAAINCNNDDASVTTVSPLVTFPPTPVGTEKVSLKVGVELAPNPVITTLNVSLSKLRIKAKAIILDIHGRTINQFDLNDGKTSLDVANLPSGLYMLVISDGNFRSTARFVKH